ncbi:MAG: type II toxin-antitoxin system RelE/ParE family toxin [Tepidisphaeraceae bacterium]
MADAFDIVYAPEAVEDIRGLRAFDRTAVLRAVEQNLLVEPMRESRSRIKRMIQPFWSQFRLRSGDFRVYYDVDESTHAVQVLRVLSKGTSQTPAENP